MKGQKVGRSIGICFGFLEFVVSIQVRNHLDCFRHQQVRLPDHPVPFFQFPFCEVERMTLPAGFLHPLSLFAPVFLGEPCQVGRLDDVQAGCWSAFWAEDAERFQDRGTGLRPRLVFGHGQAKGQKAPRGSDFVISLFHMTGLACGRCRCFRKDAVLREQVSHAVFGGRVHFPLGMVESHMTGLASLRLPGFDGAEYMAGMAGVTGGKSETSAFLLKIRHVFLAFQTDLVATPAALHSFHQGHRLPVSRGHGLHGRPGLCVFTGAELVPSNLVAHAAAIRLNGNDLVNIIIRHMGCAVTNNTGNLILAVFAQLPVGDDLRRVLLMALGAVLLHAQFLFYRKLQVFPALPPALEGIDLSETFLFKLLRRPGASRLIGSGTVENNSLGRRVFFYPVADFFRVSMGGARYFHIRNRPLLLGADI